MSGKDAHVDLEILFSFFSITMCFKENCLLDTFHKSLSYLYM